MPPPVSIIIPFFNYEPHLYQLLDSFVAKEDYPTYELILIHDNSKESTRPILQNWPTLDINYIPVDEHLGFAKINNLAAEYAKYDFLCLLNYDTVLFQPFLMPMIEARQSDPNTLLIGNIQLYPSGKVQHSGVYFEDDRSPKHLLSIPPGEDGLPYPTPAACGCCLLIKKKDYQCLGGLTQEYHNGYEDTDLSLKVWHKGFKVMIAPRSKIIHFGQQSLYRFSNERTNRMRYLETTKDVKDSIFSEQNRLFKDLSKDAYPRPQNIRESKKLFRKFAKRQKIKILMDLKLMDNPRNAGGISRFIEEVLLTFKNSRFFVFEILIAESVKDYFERFRSQSIRFLYLTSNKKDGSTLGENCYVTTKDIEDPFFLHRRKIDQLFCPLPDHSLATPGIPSIFFIPDLLHIYYPHSLTTNDLDYRERLTSISTYVATTIINPSKHVAEAFKIHYPESTDLVTTVPHWITLPNSIRRTKNTPDFPYIVYPANFWSHKNHTTLINAFRHSLGESDDDHLMHLVLVGTSGNQKEAIKRLILEGKQETRIHIYEDLSVEEYYSLLHHSLAIIHPSLYEGFGIPLIEAKYLRKKILTSNNKWVSEIQPNDATYFDAGEFESISRAIACIDLDRKDPQKSIARNYSHILPALKLKLTFLKNYTLKKSYQFRGIHPFGFCYRSFSLSIALKQSDSVEITLVSRINKLTLKHYTQKEFLINSWSLDQNESLVIRYSPSEWPSSLISQQIPPIETSEETPLIEIRRIEVKGPKKTIRLL